MIQNKLVFIIIFFWVTFLFHSIVFATEPSNQQIIDKMEMYQQINNTKFELVLQQIQQLRQDMDKRFEQVDKRFEQVDKRFEFLQQIILALLALTVGTPFVVEIWKSHRSQKEKELLDQVQRLFAAMREESFHDEKLRKLLQSAKML